jgi:hypothetical protein
MFDQERLSSGAYLPPWVHAEHHARYRFAALLNPAYEYEHSVAVCRRPTF